MASKETRKQKKSKENLEGTLFLRLIKDIGGCYVALFVYIIHFTWLICVCVFYIVFNWFHVTQVMWRNWILGV